MQRHLNLDNLKLRKFEPGAVLLKNGKQYEIADPLREPETLIHDLFNPLISSTDKLRMIPLSMRLLSLSTGDIFAGKGEQNGQDESTEAYLRTFGFSEQGLIQNFARPFFGGIFLDRTLSTSARMFQFTFKMLATGDTVLPAEGMQRIPEQLAATLPAGSIRLNTPVSRLLIENGRARGVALANGEQIEAEQVVVATSGPAAAKLTGLSLPETPVSSVSLYFAGDERLYSQRMILLNANERAYINEAVLLTNIAPTYAPPHRHLLAVTVPGNPQEDDGEIVSRCRAELALWFPHHDLTRWQHIATYRIPFSQFAQPPGIYDRLPENRTAIEGLFLAGEYTKSSSIQGAMHSGEHAAKAILAAPARV